MREALPSKKGRFLNRTAPFHLLYGMSVDMLEQDAQGFFHLRRCSMTLGIPERFHDVPHPQAVPTVFAVQANIRTFRDDKADAPQGDAKQKQHGHEHGEELDGNHQAAPPAGASSSPSHAGQPTRSRQCSHCLR